MRRSSTGSVRRIGHRSINGFLTFAVSRRLLRIYDVSRRLTRCSSLVRSGIRAWIRSTCRSAHTRSVVLAPRARFVKPFVRRAPPPGPLLRGTPCRSAYPLYPQPPLSKHGRDRGTPPDECARISIRRMAPIPLTGRPRPCDTPGSCVRVPPARLSRAPRAREAGSRLICPVRCLDPFLEATKSGIMRS